MFKVTPTQKFLSNPIKWWKDRKSAKLLEKIIAYRWEHGMKEEVESEVRRHLLGGRSEECNHNNLTSFRG